MKEYYLSTNKIHIRALIKELSEILKIDPSNLSFLEERLDYILLKTNSIETILNNYLDLFLKDMGGIISSNVTAGFQVGIKNKYFTLIGYYGKSSITKDLDINENTYFSLDSISKIFTSLITILMIRDGKITLNSTINEINNDFNTNTKVEDILKFRALLQTEKKIDNLSTKETIDILKRCKEDLEKRKTMKNYYQYNDIGYMMLRLSIPNFLDRLTTVLNLIDKNNITYNNLEFKDNTTGGRKTKEYITPDTKGRNIPFPGHTGIYANMNGLLNFFYKVFYTNTILSKEEIALLLKQPYQDPYVYNEDGSIKISNNGKKIYATKVSGLYHKPNNITDKDFNKLFYLDLSNLTTSNAIASAGTCGSWVMGDNLTHNNHFGSYVGGILTNPYSFIEVGEYPNTRNEIPNTNLAVNKKGVILNYSSKLNDYKEKMAEYGILLELLTEYIKNTDEYLLKDKEYTLIRKLKKPV